MAARTSWALALLAPLLMPAVGEAAAPARPVRAVSAEIFLSSLGINTHIDQGYDPKSYIGPLRYLGVREVRDGERHADREVEVARATGVRFDIIGSGDVASVIATATLLARNGALLAVEGANEPNNFTMKYRGLQGGGPGHSWYAVAAFQAALFAAVRHDPALAAYPVFGPSETGAETDNVGVQFRVIPRGAGTVFPAGTEFSNYVSIHNYVSGVSGGYADNQAWDAASPTLNGRWDGLYANCGLTWFRHFRGYSDRALPGLPRATTETGWDSVSGPGGEAVQAAVLVDTYLAQFKRGWRYTFIYELRDGEGGPGHQGLYSGMRPKPAAVDIHNLTTILADTRPLYAPGTLRYIISGRSATVHDLLLQKSSGEFDLVIWDERAAGQDSIRVTFPYHHLSLKEYDVTKSVDPVLELRRTNSVDLKLTNHAIILGLTR